MVAIRIYDLQARLVRQLLDGETGEGTHHAEWDGRADDGAAMPTGTYLVRLNADGEVRSCKVSLIR